MFNLNYPSVRPLTAFQKPLYHIHKIQITIMSVYQGWTDVKTWP